MKIIDEKASIKLSGSRFAVYQGLGTQLVQSLINLMLNEYVETKAITELALTFGSTWIINSIVITSLLIMSFIANYSVSKITKINKPIILLIVSKLYFLNYIFYNFFK